MLGRQRVARAKAGFGGQSFAMLKRGIAICRPGGAVDLLCLRGGPLFFVNWVVIFSVGFRVCDTSKGAL